MSLPHYLTPDNIFQGIHYIDQHGVPKRRESARYVLKWEGKDYPPKYTICVAHISHDRKEYPNVFSGGDQANNFLIARGFKIWNKDTGEWVGVEPISEDESTIFEEGAAAYKRHLSYERDSRVAKLAKQKRLEEKKELRCDICSFSFSETYGSLGTGHIEAHHTIPISQIGKLKKGGTRLSDIALVCSNCHRMVHRYRPWLSITEIKKIRVPKSQPPEPT